MSALQLATLSEATGVRYIVGLPLWDRNSYYLAQQMMAKATEKLGDAVIAFELGNEPRW